jgi:hypothetical protein
MRVAASLSVCDVIFLKGYVVLKRDNLRPFMESAVLKDILDVPRFAELLEHCTKFEFRNGGSELVITFPALHEGGLRIMVDYTLSSLRAEIYHTLLKRGHDVLVTIKRDEPRYRN